MARVEKRNACRVWSAERDHLEDLDVDWRIILKYIFQTHRIGGMDWINLFQDRNKWRAVVNTVMKTRFP